MIGRKSLFKSKRNKSKKILYRPSKKRDFKSRIKQVIKILYDLKIKNDRKTEEIKNILYDPKKEEDYYRPIKINNAFNDDYIEYKSNGDKDKILSVKEYLNVIRQYLNDIINDNETIGEWKIQLTMKINFVSSKDSNETRTMHTTSFNIEIMIGNQTDEIIEKLFESILKRYQKGSEEKYQKGLKEKMKGREFIYDSVELLHYKLHKISLNRGGSYIDSPEWLKSKKATTNPKNNDDKCFQYAVTVALNYQNIKYNPKTINNINPFMNQYDWKEIEFPSHKKDWTKFESNNNSIALDVLYFPHNSEKIRPAYVSKHNFNRKNQVILFMITDNKKWHYLAVKKLPTLLTGITSTSNGDHYCLNCLHSFRTKDKLEEHGNVCKDLDYCCVEMPNDKILK